MNECMYVCPQFIKVQPHLLRYQVFDKPSSETELRLTFLQYCDLPPLITVEDRHSCETELRLIFLQYCDLPPLITVEGRQQS